MTESMDTAASGADVIGLPALEARLQQDLRWLALPAPSWVPPREVDGERVLDVAIIGGGMAGLAASVEMHLMGIANRQTFDRAPVGREGPWIDYARMRTLRSPKILTGPALRLPALTFRAWFEAQFGEAAWDALDKIPRVQWMDYLLWYRKVFDLPIANEVAMENLHIREDGLLALTLKRGTETHVRLARHVVLATGRDGLGGPYVPDIAKTVPRQFWAHSADAIDFAALKGKRVGVIGAGASAFDNAASALEAGAARVDLLIRRKDIPRINTLTGIGSPGLAYGFAGLDDEWKWRFLHYAGEAQTPPPRDSVLRVSRFDNAYFHVGTPITSLRVQDGAVDVETPKGTWTVDFLIFGTGFHSNILTRPELSEIAPHVRLWKDRFAAPADQESAELADSPDLAYDFSFQERVVGSCPGLARIHCFNHAASLSAGKVSGDIPGVSIGAQRLTQGIATALFRDDRTRHYAALQAYSTPELQGDEWADADADTGSAASQ